MSNAPPPHAAHKRATEPHVGVALGGGSARGLAHILMLEVLDELGVVPVAIAGTSIGAIIGAAYAAGRPAKDIRAHCEALLGNRTALLKRFASTFPASFTQLWSPRTPNVVDGVTLLEVIMPEALRCDFSRLVIPFTAVATDFYANEQVALSHGPVIPAVAASAALPSIMRPVVHEGRVLIDGGFVNPTPYDLVMAQADITIAVDVTGSTKRRPPEGAVTAPEVPTTMEAWVGATQILFHSITREKLKNAAPDIFIRPDVGHFSTLDFWRIDDIFAAAEPAKDELRRLLAAKLAAA